MFENFTFKMLAHCLCIQTFTNFTLVRFSRIRKALDIVKSNRINVDNTFFMILFDYKIFIERFYRVKMSRRNLVNNELVDSLINEFGTYL